MATDYDCWHSEEENVTVEKVIENLKANAQVATRIVKATAATIQSLRPQSKAHSSLKDGLMTRKEIVPKATRVKLDLFTKPYWGEFKENWPIWIKDYDDNKHAVGLDQGDILVYHGTELEHWRDKFEGEKQYQVFMHYVDGEGKFKDRVFDGRSNLGLRK